ncbi:unnamed protein product [Prunus armeniaca]
MRVFISTHMLLLKFSTIHGTNMVRDDQLRARSCYVSTVKSTNSSQRHEALSVTKAQPPPQAGAERHEDSREEPVTQQAKPVEDPKLVCLYDDLPNRYVQIGTALWPDLHSAFIDFLHLNSVVFAWSYNNMPGISPYIISLQLSINPIV